MTCKVKICGITGVEDALLAGDAGADYLGVLVDVKQSPRSVSMDRASKIIAAAKIPVIILTYDHPPHDLLMVEDQLHPSGVQLAGNESYAYVASVRRSIRGELWKSLHLPPINADTHVPGAIADQIKAFSQAGINKTILDTSLRRGNTLLRGGTGSPCDWELAGKIKELVPEFIFLAGGINPENVQRALLQVRPDGIDASSGVERSVGKKDPALVKKLIQAAKKSSDMSSFRP